MTDLDSQLTDRELKSEFNLKFRKAPFLVNFCSVRRDASGKRQLFYRLEKPLDKGVSIPKKFRGVETVYEGAGPITS